LDADTGVKIWDHTTGSSMFSSPAVAYDKVFIGSIDGKVHCLDARTSVEIWNYTTGFTVFSSPAVADGKIYVGSDDYKMYCLNADIGVKIWDYTTGDEIRSSPAVVNGKVYIGSYQGKMYCFGNQPPPTITGPARGTIGIATNYNFTAIDPEGNGVYYFIDWGDNTNSGWIGPYASGVKIIKSHTWSTKSNYTISAKVKDSYGDESDWAQLQVTMPKGMTYFPSLFFKLIERFMERFLRAFSRY
jgi:hypothetical protein